MNSYKQKLEQLRKTNFSNEHQINAVIAIRAYLNSNYGAKFNLNTLSSHHNISKYHLLRLFKKYYGQTPLQYLNDKRIEKAKNSLSEGVSVTQTCYLVGFESIGSFSRLFKLKTGKTPSNFRKEQFSINRCK